VEDMNNTIKRFLMNFKEAPSSQGDDDYRLPLHTKGKYEKLIRHAIEGDSLDVNAL